MRVSPALVQLDVGGGPRSTDLLATYLQRLAEHRLNLPFVTFSGPDAEADDGDTIASLCVEAEGAARAREIAFGLPELAPRLREHYPVAALSIFPHRHELTLLARTLEALYHARVPLLALGSSISALTLTLAHRSLEQALDALDAVLALPTNHTPLRSTLKIIQLPREESP
jgi:hypothetical protein